MILCDTEIVAVLRTKQLVIEPTPRLEHVTTSAIDLTLGNEFKRWKQTPAGAALQIDPAAAGFSFKQVGDQYLENAPMENDGSVLMQPKTFLLGITAEKVHLPNSSRIAARVEGRSTLARLGIGVHVTAPTIHAGFRGHITLEFTNHGILPVKLRPGLRVCQLIVELLNGTPSADLSTAFQNQMSVVGQ